MTFFGHFRCLRCDSELSITRRRGWGRLFSYIVPTEVHEYISEAHSDPVLSTPTRHLEQRVKLTVSISIFMEILYALN